MSLTIRCANLNQLYPWTVKHSVDNARMEFDRPLMRFHEPIIWHIMNPRQICEFFPDAIGNPFRKLEKAVTMQEWSFETWTEEDEAVHGFCMVNADLLAVDDMCREGVFASICFEFCMLVAEKDKAFPLGSLRIMLTKPSMNVPNGGMSELMQRVANADLATVYSQLHTAHPFNVGMKTWHQDASIFNDRPMAVGYRDGWFRKIAKPMAAAGLAMDDNNFEVAREILEQMPANNDWRLAGEIYIDTMEDQHDKSKYR